MVKKGGDFESFLMNTTLYTLVGFPSAIIVVLGELV